MRSAHILASVLLLLIILVSLSLPTAIADTPSSSEETLYTASGNRSEGYYPFAGGGSCCGCGTQHYGTLPNDFPEQDVSTLTFFLTASRSNSLYTSIEVGSTAMTLVLTDPISQQTYSSTATSVEVEDGMTLPIDVPWYITFKFEPTIKDVVPGWKWELKDGDDNLLSAVWLHMSDLEQQGLPGNAETYGCQYAEKRNAWYSVYFGEAGDGQGPVTLVPLNATRVSSTGPILETEVTSMLNESIDAEVTVLATFLNTGETALTDSTTVNLSNGSSKIVSFTIPMSIEENTPMKVDWAAICNIDGTAQTFTYTDYVVTAVDTTVEDSTGYIVVVDNIEDDTFTFEWDGLLPEYKDTVFTTDDGKVKLLIVEYTTHNSLFNRNINPINTLQELKEEYYDGSQIDQAVSSGGDHLNDLNNTRQEYQDAAVKTGDDLVDWSNDRLDDLQDKKQGLENELQNVSRQIGGAAGGQLERLNATKDSLTERLQNVNLETGALTASLDGAGISNFIGEQIDSLSGRIDDLKSSLDGLGGKLESGGAQVLSFVEGLKDAADFMSGAASTLGILKDSPLADKFGALSAGYDIGKPIIQGLACKLKGKWCPAEEEMGAMIEKAAWGTANIGAYAVGGLAGSAVFMLQLDIKVISSLGPEDARWAEETGQAIGCSIVRASQKVGLMQDTHRKIDRDDYDTLAYTDSDACSKYMGIVGEDTDREKLYAIPLNNYHTGEITTLAIEERKQQLIDKNLVKAYRIDNQSGYNPYEVTSPDGKPISAHYKMTYIPDEAKIEMQEPEYDFNYMNLITLDEKYLPNQTGGDLDLHIYVDDKHIGINKETGLMENEVPGAWFSGDMNTASSIEMVVLPADVDEYRIAVDAEGAAHAKEVYVLETQAVRGMIIEDRRTGEEQINQGEIIEHQVKVVERDGEIILDSDFGERITDQESKGGGGSIVWIAIPIVAVLAAIAGLFFLLRKKLKAGSMAKT